MSLSACIQNVRKVKITAANPEVNAIYNAGDLPHTTDWASPTGGLPAYGWKNISQAGGGQPSIVTGNGFVGNAQRLYDNLNANIALIIDESAAPISEPLLGNTYVLSFKYRTNNFISVGFSKDINSSGDLPVSGIGSVQANTGDAKHVALRMKFEGAEHDYTANQIYFLCGPNNSWFEIDEVRLYRLNRIEEEEEEES